MGRAVIRKGDRTSHGGTVLEGNEDAICLGLPIAQRGHMTFCPVCKGKFPIAEGLDFHSFAGLGTAVEGMKTACGATLIASQHIMTIEDQCGAGKQPATTAEQAAQPSQPGAFKGSFQAIDKKSGQPIPGMPYWIALPDGSVLQRGETDAEGYTEAVTGHDPSTVTLHWGTYAANDHHG